MRMFSSLRVFVFLSVLLLFFISVADVHAQEVGSLEVLDVSEATVGGAIEATFLAQINGEPAVGVQLTIQYSGITNVTISNGGVTNFLGTVTVTGTLVNLVDASVTAIWGDRGLSARADCPCLPYLAVYSTVDNSDVYVGGEVTVTFFVPAGESPLYITAENIEIISIQGASDHLDPILPSNYTTSPGGELVVTGVFTGAGDAFIQAHWDRPHPADDFAASADFEVRMPLPPTTLAIVSGNNQHGDSGTSLQPFVVVVNDRNGEPLSGVDVAFLHVTTGGGQVTSARTRTNRFGRAETILTLGPEVGIYQVEASVVGYPSLRQTFTAAATTIESGRRVPTTLSIVSGYGQEGTPGTRLANPFVVEVRDQDGKASPNANVSFRVTQGGGRLSSTTVHPRNPGQFQATLTLGSSAGVNVVEVTLADIASSPKIIFTATALAPPPPPPEPVVIELPTGRSAEHPLVYWIEDNAIYYRPTGGEKMLLLNPRGTALTGGLAVDMVMQRIYWAEQMGVGIGRIQSANLNGEEVREIKLIRAVPNGIAVGTNKRNDRWIYWTTSSGKIQRIEVNGSGFNGDLVSGVNSPKHIVFDEEGDRLYWTETGRIRSVAANGKGKKETVVKNLGELGGIAVANGIVYWTEQTGNGEGKVRSINGNGSTPKLLAGLESVPEGIAVDAIGGKVYWTTSMGEIQSAAIAPVVEGDGIRATGIALGGSSSVPSSPAAPSISSVRPEGSVLLANYPNPFNPETWIPYQLAEATDVTVSIYSVNGHLIRTLALGHQSAGVYQSKSRAAYWDGCNGVGEPVASGLYFYTLTAGDFTATRKMLIRK